MLRYRITTQTGEEPEQTRVLLPDQPSAAMQAEELARREKQLHVRVYREETGVERRLELDFPPRD